jgi:hypothetical protein
MLQWREDEIDELESALEASLHEVRRQRALVRERQQAASAFVSQLERAPSALLRDAIDPRLCEALGIREGALLSPIFLVTRGYTWKIGGEVKCQAN